MIVKEITTTEKDTTFTAYWNWHADTGYLSLLKILPRDIEFDDDEIDPPDEWDWDNIYNWFRRIEEEGLSQFKLKSISFNICTPEEEFMVLL